MPQSVFEIWDTITESFLAQVESVVLYQHWTQSQVSGLRADATVSTGKVSLTSGNSSISNN